jgi:ATP-binding cassette subfamily B (MDR/TAP) protein 1
MGGATADAKKDRPAARPFASSFMSVFAHADKADVTLMVLGLTGAIGDGASTPAMLLIISRIFNDIGSGPDHLQEEFSSKINEVRTHA